MNDEEKTKAQLIEELKKARDECAQFRERAYALDRAVQNMQLGVTITDTKGKILYTNPAEARMHGYSVEELRGRDARILAPEELGRPLSQEEMKNMRSWTREGINIRKDRSIFPVKLMSDVMLDEEGVPIAIVTTCEDITDRQRGEAELRQYRDNLKALVEERTREASETAERLLQEVAERKRAEAQLLETHERLLAVMDSLGAGVYVADMENHEILFANRHVQERFGDVVGKTCWQTLRQGLSGPCEFCNGEKLVASDGTPTGVHTWEGHNAVTGEWIEVRDQAIRWIDGRFVRMEIASDITERKRAEQALVESEQKFRGLVEQSLVGIYILQDGKVKYANPKAAEIFGYTQEEITALHSVLDLILESDRALVEENIRKRLHGEIESVQYTARGKRKDGIPVHLEIHGTLTRFEGEPAIVGTLLDITERREIEEHLRVALKRAAEEKNRTEAVIAAMGDGISIQDKDFRVMFQNQVHKEMVGDHIGEYCYRGYQKRDSICEQCHLAMSFKDGKVHRKEQFRKTPEGTFYYEIISSPLKDSRGEVIACIEAVRDITVQKRVAEESEKLIEELRGALSNVRTLRGLLPICASCKKIRDDKGYWNQIEAYIRDHTDADFSHGICPECKERLYPGL